MIINEFYNKVINLAKLDNSQREILELFSIYVSSNKSYKYNATYLLDCINEFYKKVQMFDVKNNIAREVFDRVDVKKLGDNDYILFDDTFAISPWANDIKFIDDISQKKIPTIKEFNFYELSEQDLVIRVCSDTPPINETLIVKIRKDDIVDISNEIIDFIRNYLDI